MDAALGLGNAAQTAVTFNPVTEVQGRDDGSSRMGRSRSMVDPRLPPEVARVLQQREATNFPPRKKGWGRGRASSSAGAMGDERQQQQQTQRRVSSAGAQQEEFADERMARRGSRLASQAMYAAGSSSMGSDSNVGGGGKGGLWPFSRNKKRGSGAVGGGVGRPGGVPKADVKKGVWGSLQVRCDEQREDELGEEELPEKSAAVLYLVASNDVVLCFRSVWRYRVCHSPPLPPPLSPPSPLRVSAFRMARYLRANAVL